MNQGQAGTTVSVDSRTEPGGDPGTGQWLLALHPMKDLVLAQLTDQGTELSHAKEGPRPQFWQAWKNQRQGLTAGAGNKASCWSTRPNAGPGVALMVGQAQGLELIMNQGQADTTVNVDSRIEPGGDPGTGQWLLALHPMKDLVSAQLADQGTGLSHAKEGLRPHARMPGGKRQFLMLSPMQDLVLVSLEDPDAGPDCWSWKHGQLAGAARLSAGPGVSSKINKVQGREMFMQQGWARTQGAVPDADGSASPGATLGVDSRAGPGAGPGIRKEQDQVQGPEQSCAQKMELDHQRAGQQARDGCWQCFLHRAWCWQVEPGTGTTCKGRNWIMCRDIKQQEAVPGVVPGAGPGVDKIGRTRCRTWLLESETRPVVGAEASPGTSHTRQVHSKQAHSCNTHQTKTNKPKATLTFLFCMQHNEKPPGEKAWLLWATQPQHLCR